MAYKGLECDTCDGANFGADMEHSHFEDAEHQNGETRAIQVFECPCCHSQHRRWVCIPTVLFRALKNFWDIPRDDPLFAAARDIRDGVGAQEQCYE